MTGIVASQALNIREPLLSVIVPNYNHMRYLARAIDAIAGQSRSPDEIIVIDDASTDGSRYILAECQSRHPNLIVLVNDRNLGALATLQRGLEVAKGRYVYFAAADDQILPGFFVQAIDALEAAPTLGLFCAETLVRDGITGHKLGTRPIVRPLRRAGALSPTAVKDLLKRADNFIHTGSSIFRRRAVLAKCGFLNTAGSFSDGFLARRIALTEGMWFAPTLVAIWNVHTDGLSRVTALDQAEALHALSTLPQLIERDRDFPPWYPELFRRRWRFGSARLALEQVPPKMELLAAMAPDTPADRAVIGMLAPLAGFRIGRLTILAWLTLRLRPFRIRDIAVTAFDRAVENSKLFRRPSSGLEPFKQK